MNHSRTVEFVVINANPIDISIEQISFTVPKARLQLAQIQRLNGTETDVIVKKTIRKDNIVKVRNNNDFHVFIRFILVQVGHSCSTSGDIFPNHRWKE